MAYARQVVPEQLKTLARQAGAEQIEVQTTREDWNVPVSAGWGTYIYLGTELTFKRRGGLAQHRTHRLALGANRSQSPSRGRPMQRANSFLTC